MLGGPQAPLSRPCDSPLFFPFHRQRTEADQHRIHENGGKCFPHPQGLWILFLEESHLSDGLWRVCVRGARGWVPASWCPFVRRRGSGGGGWKSPSQAASSSPSGDQALPPLSCSCVPTNFESLLSPRGSTTPLARSQDFYILFGMSDPSQLPLHEGQTLRGVCAHLIMPVYLLS